MHKFIFLGRDVFESGIVHVARKLLEAETAIHFCQEDFYKNCDD